MKQIKTLTVNGQTYRITDPEAVLYTAQILTPAQQTQARENIGAEAAAGQYELIEDITLTEDVASIDRTHDQAGNSYNFTAVRICAEVAAAESSGTLALRVNDGFPSSFYMPSDAGIAASKRASSFIVRNDHGMVGCTAVCDNSYNVLSRAIFGTMQMDSIKKLRLVSSPNSVVIPAGSHIQIWAIRG